MTARADIAVGAWLEHADAARALWDQGLSAAAIAGRIGAGATKNGILGFAHRNGWPPRPSPIAVNGMRPASAAPRKPQPPKAPKVPKPRRKPSAPVLPATTRQLPTVRTCQWIPEDCNDRPWRFCGQPTKAGSPYCESHHSRAYTRRSLAEAA